MGFSYDYSYSWYPDTKKIEDEMIKATKKKIRVKFSKRLHRNLYYYNVPAAFDIEDYSFYKDGKKQSTMYVWQFAINGHVILGRTWAEFLGLCSILEKYTNPWTHLIIYIHFMEHEFSFMRKLFDWDSVFCKKERDPIYAITTTGLEFRDSYILTAKSLEKSAEDLQKYPIKKMVGDLDYDLPRGCTTPLTDKEIEYCAHDVLTLNGIIQEKIESEKKGLASIPLTNTGYVRRYLREACLGGTTKKNREMARDYQKLMSELTMTVADYYAYKRAFAGGFTHANALYVEKDIKGRIDSDDFTSSYPAVMLSEKYPMSRPTYYEKMTAPEFMRWYRDPDYLMIFAVCFTGLRMKSDVYENPISYSKCDFHEGVELNNGRVVRASYLVMTITNVDLGYISKFYDWDTIRFAEVRVFKAGYLPEPIIRCVLDLYLAKTTLKGIPEKVVEYMVKKGMLNSCYGCTVTDPLKDEIIYSDDEWGTEKVDVEEGIENYNNSKKRFLYYPWGVFITAYARRNLMTAILELGKDYIYSDTDSVKYLNRENHIRYFKHYNEVITKKITDVLTHYGIDPAEACPKTIKGVPKQIGVWDWETEEAPYTEFKTLGAKRYMYTQDGDLHTTIAGLSKKDGLDFIKKMPEPYHFFSNEMSIPAGSSGRLTHTYIDSEETGMFTDYLGKEQCYHEMSSVHLEPGPFTLSIAKEFLDYLKGYRVQHVL